MAACTPTHGDVIICFPQVDHRKSKFGLSHAIMNEVHFALLNGEARILTFDNLVEENQ
jgi:hypothetical protein